ncbi:hypothetical protein [Prochlorococcus marinus]|uniref:hypothetical protein n=1 Tax=Prochlorococcus marinus TaxID=1219 RepID=UPI0022B5AB6D|nr:hypothetical protein [Prochlorococcus marinus]
MIKKASLLICTLVILFSNIIFVPKLYALDYHSLYHNIKTNDFSYLITLNYEAKDPTTLNNPVIDPNFNVMRKKELNKGLAIPLVVGILLLAVAAPLGAWWFFSK